MSARAVAARADMDVRLPPRPTAASRVVQQLTGHGSRGRGATPEVTPTDGGLAALAADLLANWKDGRIKLYLVERALEARRAHPEAFTTGAYEPLQAAGGQADHVVAFARRDADAAFLTVAPRLVVGLTGERTEPPLGPETWTDTVLPLPGGQPGDTWRSRFTGEIVTAADRDGQAALPLARVLRVFPVALLERV